MTISLFISIYAFIISIITLLINIVTVMDYPIDDLTINQLKEDENLYELQFSIKNCGHCKLKLDFALYFIESIKAYGKLDSFLRCETKKIGLYLDELLKRINKNLIKVYSLKAIFAESIFREITSINISLSHNSISFEILFAVWGSTPRGSITLCVPYFEPFFIL